MIAPDLAAEVVSPNDLSSEVSEKVEEYQAAGIPLVWVVDPEIKTVVIHRADRTVSKIYAGDDLSGEGALPGFQCKVVDLFPACRRDQVELQRPGLWYVYRETSVVTRRRILVLPTSAKS